MIFTGKSNRRIRVLKGLTRATGLTAVALVLAGGFIVQVKAVYSASDTHVNY